MIRFPYVLAALIVAAALPGAVSAATKTSADDGGLFRSEATIWDSLVWQDFSPFYAAGASGHKSREALHLHVDSTEPDSGRIDSDFLDSTDLRRHRHERQTDGGDRHGGDRRDIGDGPDAAAVYSLTDSPFSAQFDRGGSGVSKNSELDIVPAATGAPLPMAAVLAPLVALLAAMCGVRLRRRAVSEQ